ncbi:hypothetical protein GCM10010136_27890 [Limoniibacter endophyticus]|uniref:Uncharacterized protein n=1 Tax=Limoniibacter endophyticus TaxID=1565040 RepID=A0A8J3DRH6_9HYPH|nr:hypothetical protein GCM10010136_27890 [Limoniibacter endophyticus]
MFPALVKGPCKRYIAFTVWASRQENQITSGPYPSERELSLLRPVGWGITAPTYFVGPGNGYLPPVAWIAFFCFCQA